MHIYALNYNESTYIKQATFLVAKVSPHSTKKSNVNL